MEKKVARTLYREKRAALSAPERAKLDDLLLIQFQGLELPYLTHVLSYRPIEKWNEVNSLLFTDYLAFRNPGLVISYPVTNISTAQMDAVVANDHTAFQSVGNLQEPKSGDRLPIDLLDLILVPLLAFDESGHRIGYGKGCYDRFLRHCREDCVRVGLSYFPPLERIDDTGQFDVPLNYCITPQRVYAF